MYVKKRFSFSFKLKFLLFSMSFLVSRCFKARKDYKHYWEILFIWILFKPELAPVLLELPVHRQQSPLYPQPLPQMLSLLSCLNRSMTLPWKTIILESSFCILRPLFFLATPLPLSCKKLWSSEAHGSQVYHFVPLHHCYLLNFS